MHLNEGGHDVQNAAFERIEMLQIPSDTDLMDQDVNNQEFTTSGDKFEYELLIFPLLGLYTLLPDWLSSTGSLKFEFDAARYHYSQELYDTPLQAYFEYVNTLYKALEVLSKEGVTRINIEANKSTFLFSKYSFLVYLAFDTIIEAHQHRLAKLPTEPKSYEKLLVVSSVLDCLQANYFCLDERIKPEKLATWINKFEPKPYQDITQTVMVDSSKPYMHPSFWNVYLSQMILRGLTVEAADAISCSKYQEIENDYPEIYYSIVGLKALLEDYSVFALKGKFDEWKLAACMFREALPSVSALEGATPELCLMMTQIRELAYIISGFEKTIANYCLVWYEMYVALSLYQVRDDQGLYPDYFRLAIDAKPPSSDVLLESQDVYFAGEACFLDIMKLKFIMVLNYLYAIEPATAAFVAKLLEILGYLKEYSDGMVDVMNISHMHNRRSVSEYFLTVFAHECLNTHPLVPVGIGLLLNDDITVSVESRKSAITVLTRFMPLYECQTNDDLEWLLTICAKHKLHSTASELYYCRGQKSFEQGLLYESLNMFANCSDLESTGDNKGMMEIHRIIWNSLFSDSILNNRPAKDDLINDIVSQRVDAEFCINPSIRQCLAPYAVLYEFFTLVTTNGECSKKLSRLNHLIRFQHLPKKFTPLLICQFIPFLFETDKKLLTPDLIIMIELIDLFESSVIAKEATEGDQLYQYCIANQEENMSENDWRHVLHRHDIKIPFTVPEMIRVIRAKITARIGQVYVQD